LFGDKQTWVNSIKVGTPRTPLEFQRLSFSLLGGNEALSEAVFNPAKGKGLLAHCERRDMSQNTLNSFLPMSLLAPNFVAATRATASHASVG
jgi:hypothetical protein